MGVIPWEMLATPLLSLSLISLELGELAKVRPGSLHLSLPPCTKIITMWHHTQILYYRIEHQTEVLVLEKKAISPTHSVDIF